MKKSISILLVACMLMGLLLTGCTKENKEGTKVFYLNLEATKIVPENYTPKSSGVEKLAKEYLEKLKEDSESGEYRRTISDSIKVNGISYNGYLLSVDFNEGYLAMEVTEETLVRAAIVKTLIQIEGVSMVHITIDGKELVDQDGDAIGTMSNESFLENPGAQINSSLSATLNLYFASSDGKELEKETRVVHYSSNVAIEKLVIEQLMEGPKTKGLQGTIPSDTKIINVSLADGVVYVNFDDGFRYQNETISEEVVLYSIVNSLVELPNVNKVQITINGDTKGKLRYLYDLSNMYTMNENYVIKEETTENETEVSLP